MNARLCEAIAAMTENEVLKCAGAMRFIRAGNMEGAKAFIDTMTELERNKLLVFLEAIKSGERMRTKNNIEGKS